jgi:hypothetical protein
MVFPPGLEIGVSRIWCSSAKNRTETLGTKTIHPKWKLTRFNSKIRQNHTVHVLCSFHSFTLIVFLLHNHYNAPIRGTKRGLWYTVLNTNNTCLQWFHCLKYVMSYLSISARWIRKSYPDLSITYSFFFLIKRSFESKRQISQEKCSCWVNVQSFLVVCILFFNIFTCIFQFTY